MPIDSIILQPSSGSLHAAYRPVLVRVEATRTDTEPVPPVVYCDIYFNGVYYKSLFKTQPTKVNSANSEWQFDISDPAQEYLSANLSENGEDSITPVPSSIKTVMCKLRSSGFTDGLIVVEDTAPIQGTGGTDPVSGTGTETNEFYIVNAALQHEDNQDLATHLSFFKNGTWAANAWPLTHRPSPYKLCRGDHDMFPIIYTGEKELKCLKLFYKEKGAVGFTEDSHCFCNPIVVPAFTLPPATEGVAYSYSVEITGTGPMTIDLSAEMTKPDWMDISISGHTVTFTGTPGAGAAGDDLPVVFTLENACSSEEVESSINVIDDSGLCFSVGIGDSYLQLPNAEVDHPYNHTIPLHGDLPITISAIVKPDWMTIDLTGSTITFSGTPTEDETDVLVSFTLENCASDTFDFSDTFDILPVLGPPLPKFVVMNNCAGAVINNISPAFYLIYSGDPFALSYTQSFEGIHGGYSGPITVDVSGTGWRLELWKNGAVVKTAIYPNNVLNGSGAIYSFDPTDEMKITLSTF